MMILTTDMYCGSYPSSFGSIALYDLGRSNYGWMGCRTSQHECTCKISGFYTVACAYMGIRFINQNAPILIFEG
jgi:hypothetical protein